MQERFGWHSIMLPGERILYFNPAIVKNMIGKATLVEHGKFVLEILTLDGCGRFAAKEKYGENREDHYAAHAHMLCPLHIKRKHPVLCVSCGLRAENRVYIQRLSHSNLCE